MRPVLALKSDVLAGIKSGPSRALVSPGKIFIRGNYLFVNEVDKGVHIIDNSDPSHPVSVSFISIPGNLDVAVAGSYLYADMYGDLLTIDISDPKNVKLVDTSLAVFPDRNYLGWASPGGDQIIVDWITKDTTITDNGNIYFGGCNACDYVTVPIPASSGEKANYIPGIAGSMARFTVLNHYLYAVNNTSLIAFDVSDGSNPVRKSENFLGWQIETVYPFNNNLFIGSGAGMFVFNVSNPEAPEQQSMFEHARTCDPVVADGNYAFVTLRSGSRCQGFINQLDVIDVSDLSRPELIKSYEMTNPKGLGIDGDLLFICDGADGVKVYNAADVQNLKLINKIPFVDAFDVIPWSHHMIVSTAQGLKQYDYSDPANIRLLSTIKVSAAK